MAKREQTPEQFRGTAQRLACLFGRWDQEAEGLQATLAKRDARIEELEAALKEIAYGEFIFNWEKHPDFDYISAVPLTKQMADIARRALEEKQNE